VVTSFLLEGTCSPETGNCVYPEFKDKCAFGTCDKAPLLCSGGPCSQQDTTCDSPPSSCYETSGTCDVTSETCLYKQLPPGNPCQGKDGCSGVCTNGGFCACVGGAGGSGGEAGAAGNGGSAGEAGSGTGNSGGVSGGAAGEGGSAGQAVGKLPRIQRDQPGKAEVLESVQEGGCGCRTAPTDGRGAWGLGLAALALLRRRRVAQK
jgi:MYXO-CTERM domain-containing protein